MINKTDIDKFIKLGFSVTQAKQIAWADYWESKSYYSWNRRFHCLCKTCGVGADFVAAGSARDFLARSHKNHKTSFFTKK